MDSGIQESTLNQNSSSVVSVNKPSNRKWFLFITILAILSVVFIVGAYFMGKNQSSRSLVTNSIDSSKVQKSNETTPTTQKNETSENQQDIQWRVAKNLGPFSFDYPLGWHVASIWPDGGMENGVAVWLDTEPVSGAPRGGPFAKIEMQWINGVNNAKEIFDKKILDVKKNVNVKEEILDGKIGKIYHYSGELPEGMLGGQKFENYFLFIKGADDMNDIVITLGTINKEDLTETLRHIALSIESNNK